MAEGGLSDNEFLDASDVFTHCYKNCKRTDSVKMIGCDSSNCDIEWFHVECVGLTPETVPDGGWTCPPCALLLAAQQEAFQSETDTEVETDVKQKKPAKKLANDSQQKTVQMKAPSKGKNPVKEVPDYSLSSFLTSKSPLERELEEVQRKQKELELKMAKAKLKNTQDKWATYNSDKVEEEEKLPKKKEMSDIEVLLKKLYGKDSESDDEDDSGKVRKKKDRSGLYKKASDKVKIAQAWPHLSLGAEYSGKILGFNELQMSQFVAGELEIISNCNDESEKEGRLAFLKALMYDAAGCKYSSILNYYAAWVREIELGKKQWGDDFTKVGDAMLKRAALPDTSSSSTGSKKKTGKNPRLFGIAVPTIEVLAASRHPILAHRR